MLNGNAAAKRFDAFQVALGNRFAMVEEPVQALEGHLAVRLLKNIQKARDTLIVSGVQPEGPLVSREQCDNVFELRFQRRGKVGARLEEVLEICRGENEHFARAVAS